MPKHKTVKKTCYVCHTSSKQVQIPSSIRPGEPGPSGIIELEGRPKELTEYILKNNLEYCPHCGYIAGDIEEKTSITEDFLSSPDYRSLQDPKLPFSPSLYLRAALLAMAEHNREKAIDYYIRAAWCADSLLNPEFAIYCRKKALSLIFEDNKTFADISSKKWIQILDSMRRCGDFTHVITVCTSLLPIVGPVMQQILAYELSCAKQGDSEPHTDHDAATGYQFQSFSPKADEEFIIDGRSYAVDDDCFGNGWNWNAETRTLVLSNYHGNAISAVRDITIQLELMDNWIHNSHGPGIHVHYGNLKISGPGFLSINGDDGGIFVESGILEISNIILTIHTKKCGIFASGNISITKGFFDIRSETTGIKSISGGLTATVGSVLKIYGLNSGIDLADYLNLSTGRYQIESPKGCGTVSRHGSFDFSECSIDIICNDTCILLENGNISARLVSGTLNGFFGAKVNGTCSITKSNIHISGEECGLFVSKNLDISYSRCESSGKTAIATDGYLQVHGGNISASGEIGILVGGDMKSAEGILMLQGDTALQVSGNAEISAGLVMGVGRISGIVVTGSYSQSGGYISFTGEAQDGMRILGKEMKIIHSTISVSGRNCGMGVAGDIKLEDINLSVSGNIALSGRSLELNFGDIQASGEEIGISLKGGNLTVGETVSLHATGNVGIFATNDIWIHDGELQVTGQFGGIVMESGNLHFTHGVLEISGDEYGILLQSGSLHMTGGMTTVTNSRMTDSGGCGIAVEQGDMETGGILTVHGESYAIFVPCGDISIKRGKVEAYGYRSGITGKSLALHNSILTAYGKTQGAVVLSGKEPWDDDNLIVLAGKSFKTATETVYSGQTFIHAYAIQLPGVS
jgi:hypothetical protein